MNFKRFNADHSAHIEEMMDLVEMESIHVWCVISQSKGGISIILPEYDFIRQRLCDHRLYEFPKGQVKNGNVSFGLTFEVDDETPAPDGNIITFPNDTQWLCNLIAMIVNEISEAVDAYLNLIEEFIPYSTPLEALTSDRNLNLLQTPLIGNGHA